MQVILDGANKVLVVNHLKIDTFKYGRFDNDISFEELKLMYVRWDAVYAISLR